MLKFANQIPYQKGNIHFDDISALIKLRNALVHYQPEWITTTTDHGNITIHEFERLLSSRFPVCKLFEKTGNGYYPDKCLGYGCARWAVESSMRLIEDFFRKLALRVPFDHMRDQLDIT